MAPALLALQLSRRQDESAKSELSKTTQVPTARQKLNLLGTRETPRGGRGLWLREAENPQGESLSGTECRQ